MGRNLEIKAWARDSRGQARLAEALSDPPAEHLIQEDIFFKTPAGRLKLRLVTNHPAELIQYDRGDAAGPAESCYTRSPITDPDKVKEFLMTTLGMRGVVRKTRTVHHVGPTRIHLDEVEGLGDFIEAEVVLEPDQDPASAVQTMERLMAKLQIEKSDLVELAYIDLLEGQTGES